MRMLLAAMAAVLVAPAAQAEVVTVRFTGKIDYVHYVTDPFGVPDIAGPLAAPLDYRYDVTFDTAIGSLVVVPGTSALAGIGYSVSPIRRWSLTINGTTDAGENVAGDLYNNTVGRFGNASAGGWSVSYDGGVGGKKYWAASVNLTSYTGNSHIFGDPFANKNGVGVASFHHYQTRADGSFSHLYWLGADVRTATVLAGVPEPATWALMITGFGAAGTAMRRRTAVRFARA
jgi:hypothetical protein